MKDPKEKLPEGVVENSVESEILSDIKPQYLCDNTHADAIKKRMAFNQGAYDLDEDDVQEVTLRNALTSHVDE